MSHFSVFVIGDNVEQQLAPYHEFECTGEDDQYVQDVDITAKCQEKGLDWYGLDDKTVTDLSQVDKTDKHKYGYALVDGAGALIKAIKRAEYIQRARDRACVPYALVHKGEWASKGHMGWFGLSDENMPEHEWNRLVNEMLDALPDDTLITVVDCHI